MKIMKIVSLYHENSLRMITLFIHWMTLNYAFRYRLLTWKKNFLDNRQAQNYKGLVEKLLKSLRDTDINMSFKVHFLLCHLDKSPDYCVDMSDVQGEWFHQDIKNGRALQVTVWQTKDRWQLLEYQKSHRRWPDFTDQLILMISDNLNAFVSIQLFVVALKSESYVIQSNGISECGRTRNSHSSIISGFGNFTTICKKIGKQGSYSADISLELSS